MPCWLQVKAKLGSVDPYFGKLAEAMKTWIAAWRQLNPPAKGVPEANGNTSQPLANGTTKQ